MHCVEIYFVKVLGLVWGAAGGGGLSRITRSRNLVSDIGDKGDGARGCLDSDKSTHLLPLLSCIVSARGWCWSRHCRRNIERAVAAHLDHVAHVASKSISPKVRYKCRKLHVRDGARFLNLQGSEQ